MLSGARQSTANEKSLSLSKRVQIVKISESPDGPLAIDHDDGVPRRAPEVSLRVRSSISGKLLHRSKMIIQLVSRP